MIKAVKTIFAISILLGFLTLAIMGFSEKAKRDKEDAFEMGQIAGRADWKECPYCEEYLIKEWYRGFDDGRKESNR